jgi:uncharacterized protein
MAKRQRIRDPLHDLIEFSSGVFESSLWNSINSQEFQRLRRVKQLGFSELVYPGATHTRFAHSIGVFHSARQLITHVENLLDRHDSERAKIALAAALFHDLGHGPFSHAFETALKSLDKETGVKSEKRHEIWTANIIREDTHLGLAVKNSLGQSARDEIATLLLQETPSDIYSSIVSSQFDADRLDYLRRDRLMTGVSHGGFDYSWLIANIEVDSVAYSADGNEFADIESLILGHKAFQAAEAYVLGLFHMYFAVYFHKATRSAEKMMTALFVRLGGLILEGSTSATGLDERHPIVAFVKERNLGSYLRLDDTVIWGALPLMTEAGDSTVSSLARRLLYRDLYKAFDVSEYFSNRGGEAAVAKFRAALSRARVAGEIAQYDIFEDSPQRDPYKRRGYDTPDALSKVLIRNSVGGQYQDLGNLSDVVKALQKRTIYRVYADRRESFEKIFDLAKGIGQ